MLQFEWDDAKAASNILKHGVSFGTASLVFDDVFALDEEARSASHGEARRIITGFVTAEVLTVVYTERGDIVRLIPARRASRREARHYAEARQRQY